MRKPVFWFIYLLMLVVQLLLSNYFRVSPYVTLSVLPAMVLCISIGVGSIPTLLIAFATALAADLLGEGVLGMNAVALLPVALLRGSIIRLVFGTEVFARQEDFSVQRNGLGKVMLAILIAQALFLAIYIWVDSAGMRPWSFNLARFGCSLAGSMLVCLFMARLLAPDPRR